MLICDIAVLLPVNDFHLHYMTRLYDTEHIYALLSWLKKIKGPYNKKVAYDYYRFIDDTVKRGYIEVVKWMCLNRPKAIGGQSILDAGDHLNIIKYIYAFNPRLLDGRLMEYAIMNNKTHIINWALNKTERSDILARLAIECKRPDLFEHLTPPDSIYYIHQAVICWNLSIAKYMQPRNMVELFNIALNKGRIDIMKCIYKHYRYMFNQTIDNMESLLNAN